jgi:hypothetical protein
MDPLELAALVAAQTELQQTLPLHPELLTEAVAVEAVDMFPLDALVQQVAQVSSSSVLDTLPNTSKAHPLLLTLAAKSYIHSPRLARLCSEDNNGTLCTT